MPCLNLPAATPSSTTRLPAVPRDQGSSPTEQPPAVPTWNYYFVLLAILVIAVILVFLITHRRKALQRRNTQVQARNIEGWPTARRLLQGRYGAGNSVFSRRTEGLDEEGEAPPPYQPKEEETEVGIAVPLRTLALDDSNRSGMTEGGELPPQSCDGKCIPSTPSMGPETAQSCEERGVKL